MNSLNYRPDIDGLRTLAVVPVILFHAGATWLPGGFVGVDIFFVISGYLISSIILRESAAGNFSFLRFYERRLRRIIPALLVVLIVTVAVFQVIALPDQAQQTAESGIAALLSVSNFYFWRTSGYFAPAAEFMPLLHTWTLAVEEQFYLLFPLVVLVLLKLRLPIKWVFVMGTVAAFALGYWLSLEKPSVAYYLLPARAWELAIGAVLAVGVVPAVRGALMREFLPAFGIGLIVFSMFYIRSDMLFPGWVALMPCLGTAMVIHAGGQSWVAQKVLAARPVVFVGLLSYSLYLWHWPVLTALRVRTASVHLDLPVTVGAIAITFLLAWASWRYVERPFRNKRDMPIRRMLGVLGAGSALVAGIVTVSISTGGFSGRLSERASALLAGAFDTEHFQFCPEGSFENACQFGINEEPVRLVVIGDSHTPMLHRPMDTIAERMGGRGVLWWHSACPLLDGAWRENDGYRDVCFAFKEQAFSELQALLNLDTVILVGSWVGQLSLAGDRVSYPFIDHESRNTSRVESLQAFERSMSRTLTKLNDLDVNVIILGPSPGAGFDVPRALALADLNGIDRPAAVATSSVREVQMQVDVLISSVTNDLENVSYVPVWDVFCPLESCALTIGNTSLYSDGGHLSGLGATEFLGPALIQRVNAALDLLKES
jgi:peptidoglycan/LPS O-acetylase OafA/YrhL